MVKPATAASTARLSKSRFLAGCQCPLRLWNDLNRRELARPWTPVEQALFERGTEVGELARARWPGGTLVGFKPWERAEAVAETRRLIDDPAVPAIYEAAIEHEGVLVRADVLARNGDSWDLVEVKSATRPDKEVYLNDVAIQHWVLDGAGLDVHRAGLLTLNRDYVWLGGDYDLDALFVFNDFTIDTRAMFSDIATRVAELRAVAAAPEPPRIGIGPHCFDPYDCPYYGACSADTVFPDNPIDELHRLHPNRRALLEAEGIVEIRDIPEEFDLSPIQRRIREAVRTGRPWRSPDLARALEAVERPLHYLDFEACGPAVPRYPGTRPYDTIPFQFSLHIEQSDGALEHREYLHTEQSDPRRPLAEALLGAFGASGSIVVYSNYERRILNELAAALPDLSPQLTALISRLWDLLEVIRSHYYHPGFRGSFSIKDVHPALVPDAGWDGLEISDGIAAALCYEQAIATDDEQSRRKVFAHLVEYCRKDTLAMVELRAALKRG